MVAKSRFVTAAWLSFLAACAAIYLSGTWSAGFDDSFITYRYADNLLRGHGLAFNPGETHYGSTAMGFAVLLAAAAWVTGMEVATTSHVLSAVSLAGVAAIVVSISHRYLSVGATWFVGIVSALSLMASPTTRVAVGHETYPFLALLAAGSYFVFFRRWFILGGTVLALAAPVRPDGALFVAIVGLILVVDQVRARSVGWENVIGYGATVASVGTAWALFALISFGTILPETLTAKQAQIALGHWPVATLGAIAGMTVAHLTPTLLAIIVVGAVAFPSVLASHRDPVSRWCLAWALFGAGVVATYSLLGVTLWFWYVLPVMAALLFAAHGALVALAGATRRRAVAAAAAVMLFAAAVDAPSAAAQLREALFDDTTNAHLGSYDAVVRFLRREEPGGTSLATAEPGHVGYSLGPAYLVVDELGLASPGVAEAILDGDMNYPFRRWRPKYVVVSWSGRYAPTDRAWFRDAYELVAEFPHPYWQRRLGRGALLFQRRTPALPRG